MSMSNVLLSNTVINSFVSWFDTRTSEIFRGKVFAVIADKNRCEKTVLKFAIKRQGDGQVFIRDAVICQLIDNP